MAFALGLRPVFVRRPGVKNLVVVQQLDIAGFELQIQSDWITACQFIQEIECLDLFGPQSGPMVVALRGVKKVPRINTGDFAGVTMKHSSMASVGYRDLGSYLSGDLALEEALENIKPVAVDGAWGLKQEFWNFQDLVR